jgi:hypothetical protein
MAALVAVRIRWKNLRLRSLPGRRAATIWSVNDRLEGPWIGRPMTVPFPPPGDGSLAPKLIRLPRSDE